jgi:hypothetical protein
MIVLNSMKSGNEHPGVIMKLFSASLTGDARIWYNNLPNKSIKSWEDFENAFIRKWGDEKDLTYLFSQYQEIQKHEEESVREFNDRFNTLLNQIPSNSLPETNLLGQYLRSFKGDFQFLLRDKSPEDLRKAQDIACQLEDNLNSCEPNDFSQVISLQDEVMDLANTHDILINKIDIMEEEEPPTKKPVMGDEEDLPCKIPRKRKWSTNFQT